MISSPCAGSWPADREERSTVAQPRMALRGADLVAERREELVLHPAGAFAFDAGGLFASQEMLTLFLALAQRPFGPDPFGHVLEQHCNLAPAGRLDAER